MTSRSKRVLMCGGPANGTWRVVEHWEREIHVVVPPGPIRATEELEPSTPELPRAIYRIMPMNVLGHQMYVAVAIEEHYDDRAILRNLLQRDVAQHLGVW